VKENSGHFDRSSFLMKGRDHLLTGMEIEMLVRIQHFYDSIGSGIGLLGWTLFPWWKWWKYVLQ